MNGYKYTAALRLALALLSLFLSPLSSLLSSYPRTAVVVYYVQKRTAKWHNTKEAMMHPDQMYELRQLRHSDLRMESEQARLRRELTSGQAAGRHGWLATWLRRLSIRRLRGVAVTH